MIDNKLYEIFYALTKPEKSACGNFLNSPYFNRREDVLALWRLLLATRQHTDPQPEAWFREIYPGRPFDDASWRHLQSFLVARIESFLAQYALEQLPLLYDLHLAPVMREKKLPKSLNHVFRRAETRLEQLPHNQEYYYWQYRLEWEKYGAVESQARTRENNLAAVGQAFDTFLIAGKLRLACLMESHKAVYNTAYEPGFLPALLTYVGDGYLLDVPLIALYYHCYRALTEAAESDFRAFRSQLEQQSGRLDAAEQRTLLLLALNFCIRRMNTGEKRYTREAFDLYRLGLDTGSLLENGLLSRFAYKNIVAIGLRLGSFEWVESFIHRYERALEPKYQEANRDYNLARLYFAQNDYGRAMPLLAGVGESDLLLNLDSRIMLLKMYYETGEWDALDALISSFKVLLLRKKKIIGYHQTNYLKTLRYLQQLLRLGSVDKNARAALFGEIAADNAVIEKEWLMAQCAPAGS